MPRRKLIAALLAAVAGIALTVSLGNWQSRRGDEKAARQAEWDAAAAAMAVPLADAAALSRVASELPRRVEAEGRFVAEATVYLDNRLIDGVAGFMVVTPLALGEGVPWLLVNRGWAPRSMQDRAQLPAATPPSGVVRIEGLAVERVPRVLELGVQEHRLGGIWQNLDYAAFEQAAGRPVARLVVQQANDTGDGLKRDWLRPDTGVEKHRGYAFQWYSLAALIAGLTLYFGGRALRKQ